MLKQENVNIKTILGLKKQSPKPANTMRGNPEMPVFDAIFKQVSAQNSDIVYYYFQKHGYDAKTAYNLIYLPLLPGFTEKSRKKALEIDNQDPVILPLLVEIKTAHPCKTNQEGN